MRGEVEDIGTNELGNSPASFHGLRLGNKANSNPPLDTKGGGLESFPGSVRIIQPYLAAVEELVWTRQWGLKEDK